MTAESRSSWIELAEKLWVPLLIFLGGITYTVHKDRLDAARQRDEHAQAEKQQQLERDSGYVRMLASANDRERELGTRIIGVLQNEGKFSHDLDPVVFAMSTGRPSDPATQAAAQIASRLTPDRKLEPISGPTDVYIQIWQESQRPRAMQLQESLRSKGFAAPGIEVVRHPTFHTYIRYFAVDKAAQADAVLAIMTPLGFKPQVQDFAHSQEPKSEALEVWFGADEPNPPERGGESLP